jgi:hypothetical protein
MSTVSEVKLWRVYCNDESAFFQVWSPTEPTACPNNVAHTIDPDKTTVIDKISKSEVQIQEELVSTQGIYRYQGYKYTIPAGTVGDITVLNLEWDYPITLLNGHFDASLDQVGDVIDGWVVPNTPIGYTTAAVNIGDTLINVSSTVLQYIYIGYTVKITDGVNTVELGECIAKDIVNNTITVQTASSIAFSPGAYVQIIVKVVDQNYVATNDRYEFAKKKVGGKTLNDCKFQINYKNNTGLAKDFSFGLEFMY